MALTFEAPLKKHLKCFQGGRSSVVESQPSKLVVVGSNPIARSIRRGWRRPT